MATTPADMPGVASHGCWIRRALSRLAELASRLVEPTECGWMIHCGGNGLIFVADATVVTRRCSCGGTWAVEETTDEFSVGTCWVCRRLVIGAVGLPQPQPQPTDGAERRLSTTLGDAE